MLGGSLGAGECGFYDDIEIRHHERGLGAVSAFLTCVPGAALEVRYAPYVAIVGTLYYQVVHHISCIGDYGQLHGLASGSVITSVISHRAVFGILDGDGVCRGRVEYNQCESILRNVAARAKRNLCLDGQCLVGKIYVSAYISIGIEFLFVKHGTGTAVEVELRVTGIFDGELCVGVHLGDDALLHA